MEITIKELVEQAKTEIQSAMSMLYEKTSRKAYYLSGSW